MKAPPTEGTLSDQPLADVLASHAQSRSSGRLLVNTSAGVGELRLWDGAVAEARFGPAQGETALLRLIAFRQGQWTFDAAAPSISGVAAGELQSILDRAQAHQKELDRHAEKLGGLGQRFELDLAQLSRRMQDVPQEIGPVLSLVDGRRTIQDVVAASDLPDATVLRVLRKLKTMGLLRSAEEAEEARRAALAASTPPPQAPRTFEEMLLDQFEQTTQEHAALLELAVPLEMRSTPPVVVDATQQLRARAAAADAFSSDLTPHSGIPRPGSGLPAEILAPRRTEMSTDEQTLFSAPAPHRPGASIAATPSDTQPSFPMVQPGFLVPVSPSASGPSMATAASVSAPQDGSSSALPGNQHGLSRAAPPPAPAATDKIPIVSGFSTHDTEPTFPARPSVPGKDDPARDTVKRPAMQHSSGGPPAVLRWTERPLLKDDGPDGALPAERGILKRALGLLQAQRISEPDLLQISGLASAGSEDAPPKSGVSLRTNEVHVSSLTDSDAAFFSRSSHLSELAAQEEEEALKRQARGGRTFFYVGISVASAAVLLLAAIWSSAPVPDAPPVEVAASTPAPAMPRVIAAEMGAHVRTGMEAMRDISRAEAHRGIGTPSVAVSPAEVAARLANPEPGDQAPASTLPPKTGTAPQAPTANTAAAPVPATSPAVAERPEKTGGPSRATDRADPEDLKRLFAERYERGVRLYEEHRYPEAKRAFESALKFDSREARAYASLGAVSYETGDFDEALRLLRKAEALDGKHAHTFLVMGLVHQERSDQPAAERAYERYLALAPSSKDAPAVRGFLKALRSRRDPQP
jgi:tetratricopeptide (TPR) repeat protein